MRRYWFGYPASTRRLWFWQIVGFCFGAAVCIGVPFAVAALCFVVDSHVLATVPLAIGALASIPFLHEIRDRFGIRVVPQFERPLEPPPDTYLVCGATLLAQSRLLDAIALAEGVTPLSDFVVGPAGWCEPHALNETCTRLLARLRVFRERAPGAPHLAQLIAELERIATALEHACAAAVRCRLVYVAGNSMNAPLYEQLRAAGF